MRCGRASRPDSNPSRLSKASSCSSASLVVLAPEASPASNPDSNPLAFSSLAQLVLRHGLVPPRFRGRTPGSLRGCEGEVLPAETVSFFLFEFYPPFQQPHAHCLGQAFLSSLAHWDFSLSRSPSSGALFWSLSSHVVLSFRPNCESLGGSEPGALFFLSTVKVHSVPCITICTFKYLLIAFYCDS